MATQLERREATRARLVEAARRLFVERGYEATSTNDVLEAAGVSRGALYHHFATKQELFAAVFERVSEQAITRALSRTGNEGSAWSRAVWPGWPKRGGRPWPPSCWIRDRPCWDGAARATWRTVRASAS
jgi:AcrR family transcriptional regulator